MSCCVAPTGEVHDNLRHRRWGLWALLLVAVVIGLLLRGHAARWLMEKAARGGDLRFARVAVMLDASSVNAVTDGEMLWDQVPVLCLAIQSRHMSVAKYLVEKGADVNTKDRDGITALHHAAESPDVSLTTLLLSRGANPNAVSDTGWTPLLGAVRYGRERAVSALLAAGAGPNAADGRGFAPLDYAMAEGSRSMVALLESRGARTTLPVILQCSAMGRVRDVDAELRRDPGLLGFKGVYGWKPIHYASNSGSAAAAALLIARGAVADARALECAVGSGDLDTVRVLVEHGANPNGVAESGITALERAVKRADARMVRALLRLGADPLGRTSSGRTAEEYARASGRPDVIAAFVEHRRGCTRGDALP